MTSIKRRLYLFVARYFRFWANISLRRWHPRIIAVTGSVGKTTMLHLLEQQLGEKAHYSHRANSAFGISFDIVGLRGITNTKWRWLWLGVAVPFRSLFYQHKQPFYVVEIDGERPHETEFLAKWLKPEITVWVSTDHSHAVYFDTLVKNGTYATVEDAIAAEFATLPRHTQKLVVIDADNARMEAMTVNISARIEAVALKDVTSYYVWPHKTEIGIAGGTFHFDLPLPKEIGLQLQMLARVLAYLDLPTQYSTPFISPPGRSNLLAGIKNTQLIDSTYNAHLASMKSILQMFVAMETKEKWVVLGDMIEQGASEADQHAQLARYLIEQTDFDRYIIVGRRMNAYAAPLLKESKLASRLAVFKQTREALDYLEKEVTDGETILLKGSQYLEWIVEKLLKNPLDKQHLVRQEPAAVKRRKEWGLQ